MRVSSRIVALLALTAACSGANPDRKAAGSDLGSFDPQYQARTPIPRRDPDKESRSLPIP
jgi:hypothetical protein